MTCVYEHKRRDTGQVFYVGKGIRSRPYQAGAGRRSEWWCRVAEKAGGFDVSIIASGIDDELACLIEIERINQLRRIGVVLCNMTDGGDGTVGHKRSEEWCRKMSAIHKGKLVSNETRERMSASRLKIGYKASPETLKKMSAAQMGHHRNIGRIQPYDEKLRRAVSLLGNKSRTGQTRSESERAATSAANLGRMQPVVVCPHCNKEGGNAMRRWHFDACKYRV